GRTAEIEEFDIEVVLGEDAPLFCNRCSDRAGRVRIPGELELTRRALQLLTACGSAANKRVAGNIRGRRQCAGRSEDSERRRRSDSAGKREDRAAGEPASRRFASGSRSSSSC